MFALSGLTISNGETLADHDRYRALLEKCRLKAG